MRAVTRGTVLVLAVVVSAAAALAAVAAWSVTEWAGGSAETLQLRVDIQGTAAARAMAAATAGVTAVVVLLLGVAAALVRSRSVTLWLGGQQPVPAPAEVVERFLHALVKDVAGVEAARVTAESAKRGTTSLALDLTVAADADATAVQTAIETRMGSMLVPSCSIVLGGRPRITVRYALSPGRDDSSRRAA